MSSNNPPTQQTTTTTTTEQQPRPVLHLHGENREGATKKKKKSRVKWTEDVVDNEHMNKKKTKICCIFHPQRDFGELSDSSDSGSSSDSSDEEGNSGHNHDHEGCSHGRPSSPNAYEKQPTYKSK